MLCLQFSLIIAGFCRGHDCASQKCANKVYLRVVRNTLLKRAVADTEFECIQEVLVGPTILAFSQEDPGAAARVLKDFAKENDDFEIKALSVGGQLMDASQIDVLAKLPTVDQAPVYARVSCWHLSLNWQEQ